MRRDMDRALDSDAGPKGTVLCWRGSSLAQKFYVMLCYMLGLRKFYSEFREMCVREG